MAHSLSLSLLSPSIRSSFHSTGASTRDRACSSTRDRSHASEIPSRNLRFYFGRRGSSCPCSTKEGERHPFLKDELRKRPPPPPFPRPIRPGSPNHYSLSSRWGNFRSKIDFSIGPLPESVHLLNAHLSSRTVSVRATIETETQWRNNFSTGNRKRDYGTSDSRPGIINASIYFTFFLTVSRFFLFTGNTRSTHVIIIVRIFLKTII